MPENNECTFFEREIEVNRIVYHAVSHFALSGSLGEILKRTAMEALKDENCKSDMVACRKEAAWESKTNTMPAYTNA